MSNFLQILLLIFLCSCGPVELEVSEGQGLNRTETVNTTNRLENYELASLKEVCNLLKIKHNYFKQNVINFNKQFDYYISKKICSDSEVSKSEVSLQLVSSGTNISFQKVSGDGDFFSEYESREQGIIAPFCQKALTTIGSFERSIVSGNKVSWIYVISNNSTYCPKTIGTFCVIVENGQKLNDQQAVIIERHSMAISKVYGQTQGMIVGRKFETKQSCDDSYRSLYSELII